MCDVTLPWTREERAEFALNTWRELFTEPQFRGAVRQIANQMACHVEKDLGILEQTEKCEGENR